jgi:hypothetical protein
VNIFANRVELESTDDGEIPSGFLFASIKNRGSLPVLVGGITLDAGEAKSYPFVGKAYDLAVEYQLNGQPLRIMYIN